MRGRRADGAKGEEIASRFLGSLEYLEVERNFQTRYGEIDLIMRDGSTLVFIEVKLRRGTEFGDPLEAVTPSKQAKIRTVAEQYLAQNEPAFEELRFDVVGIKEGPSRRIEHIKDAF